MSEGKAEKTQLTQAHLKCAINQCNKTATRETRRLLDEIDIKPIHIFRHDDLMLSRQPSLILEQEDDYSGIQYCVSCINTYKYCQFRQFLDHIRYFKCIFCKQCKPQHLFVKFIYDIREFFNFYNNDLISRLNDIKSNCNTCNDFYIYNSVTSQLLDLENRIYDIVEFNSIENARIILERINSLNLTIFNSQSHQHKENACIIECDKLSRELDFIHMCKQRINRVSIRFTNVQTTRKLIRNSFNPVIGHMAPCNACFGKMISIKKIARTINIIDKMPFNISISENVKSFYVHPKKSFKPSLITQRILNTTSTEYIYQPKSLATICANKLNPSHILNILNTYHIDDKTRIYMYKD